MKRVLLAATLAATGTLAVRPAAAAPAPASVDAAARVELHRDHWQRAVTHARRLHDAVKEEAATRDYADDAPSSTDFAGSPARRRFQREASLRRAVTPAGAAAEAIVSPGERLHDAPASLPAAASAPAGLPVLSSDLAQLPKPGLIQPRPQGPIPVAQRGGVATLPTLDQAVDPLLQQEPLADPLRPTGPVAACPGSKPGGKRALRAGCVAPRGI